MNFEMIGKISLGKDTEKFHPFSETKYDSGWVRKVIMFNASCGSNRHMLTVQAGAFEDGHGDVYSFTKSGTDDNGNRIKGESIKIPFKERLTSPKLEEIAEFKKFIFDLEKPGRRYKLKTMIDKIHDGSGVTDEALKEVGLTDESDVAEAYEKSLKKRHEFISEWDYVDFIKKVIDSGKYADSKFLIRGNGDYSYSDKNQRVYESYVPNRIYLAADDTEEYSTATLNFLFGQDSLDDGSLEEKGKYYVNGWVMEYDRNRKSNIPVPTTIAIDAAADGDEKAQKRAKKIAQKFSIDDDSIKEYGCIVNMLNGAQKVEITEDMLTDEQKEDLELEIITMDDIRAELGSEVYGDRIREYQFVKPSKGFTKGRQETVYTSEDMVIKPIDEIIDDETDDLFDDDEDL